MKGFTFLDQAGDFPSYSTFSVPTGWTRNYLSICTKAQRVFISAAQRIETVVPRIKTGLNLWDRPSGLASSNCAISRCNFTQTEKQPIKNQIRAVRATRFLV